MLPPYVPFLDKEDLVSLTVEGEKITVRWIFQTSLFKHGGADDESYFTALAYAPKHGAFYGVTAIDYGSPHRPNPATLQKLEGRRALIWFLQNAVWDKEFADVATRVVESAQLEFALPVVRRAKVKRLKKNEELLKETVCVQLELAKALVEAVRRIGETPNVALLHDARRQASKLHIHLHQEAMKEAVVKAMNIA